MRNISKLSPLCLTWLKGDNLIMYHVVCQTVSFNIRCCSWFFNIDSSCLLKVMIISNKHSSYFNSYDVES